MEDSENIIMVKIGCREVCEKDVLPESKKEERRNVQETRPCSGRVKIIS